MLSVGPSDSFPLLRIINCCVIEFTIYSPGRRIIITKKAVSTKVIRLLIGDIQVCPIKFILIHFCYFTITDIELRISALMAAFHTCVENSLPHF